LTRFVLATSYRTWRGRGAGTQGEQ